jgi:acetyl-CoA acetyltransferase
LKEVIVAGVGMCQFGRYNGEKGHPYKPFYELGREAVMNAWKDAGIKWKDIQACFCGSCYQGVGSGHKVLAEIGLTGIPIINVENACSSSSSAFRLAYQSIATGLYDICLVIGVEKVPRGFIASTGWPEWQMRMGFNVQPAAYAMETVRYMEEYGATLEQFAKVTVKNRKNGALFPYGYFRQEVTIVEVLHSRMVSKPLTLLMCCPNADGAAAVILVSKEKFKSEKKKVTVTAAILVSSLYGVERGGGSVKIHNPDRTQIAAKQAYEASGCGPEDIDLFELYDPMAPIELISIERVGICKPGEAGHLLEEGVFNIDGRFPVNTSGGLLSRGHPLGATGLAQIAEVVWQLRGEAGPRSVPGARVGMCHTMGAGPNCAITILKA